MKKLLGILLVFSLVMGLAGCGAEAASSGEGTSSPTIAVSQVVSSVEQPPAPSESKPILSTSEPSAATEPEAKPESSEQSEAEPSASSDPIEENKMLRVNLRVADKDFPATLIRSKAAQTFAEYLPMTVRMPDLNGQEKFYDLPEDLPASSTERPSTIHGGEIMCWSGNTLVLFYSSFENSYGGYVRLGTVDDPAGLAQALGSGSAEVIWTLVE